VNDNESRALFRLNVGFIVAQTVGYSRDFPFEAPSVSLPPDLVLRNLLGSARVTRTAQGLLVQVNMRGDAIAECGRCLSSFMQPLEVEFTDLYAFTRNSVTELGLILPDNAKIELAPILREEMFLAMPISPLCRADCRGLCPVCGENLNENKCSHQEE
jgi:uncharacterized metal-binding protein YceD (DUF177 family)